jgi:hypothetical protein
MSPRDGVSCPSPQPEPDAARPRGSACVTEALRTKWPAWDSPFGALAGDASAYVWIVTISGMIRIATMFAILIIGLIAGPAVSL